MTDFGAPTTAAQALRQYADECRALAERARREAGLLTAKAEIWDEARYAAERDADRYDRWQPKPPQDPEVGDQPATGDG